jgi:subtilisin family serine protease
MSLAPTGTIAIIDTGVDQRLLTLAEASVTGVCLTRDTSGHLVVSDDFRDLDGHGTEVASIISSFCPWSSLYIVRMVDCSHATHGKGRLVTEAMVATAIEQCLAQNIRIINVSFSIADVTGRECFPNRLAEICAAAGRQQVAIVAAYRNSYLGSAYPASFSTTFGVRCHKSLRPGEIAITDRANNDLIAWGASNSIACAQVSAMLGRMAYINPMLTIDEIAAVLQEISQNPKCVMQPN